MKVYTVFDSKAEAYLPPFMATNDGVAGRMFSEACNDRKSMLGKHPADYTIFEIGSWDEQTAFYTQDGAHKNLGNGVSFVRERELTATEDGESNEAA